MPIFRSLRAALCLMVLALAPLPVLALPIADTAVDPDVLAAMQNCSRAAVERNVAVYQGALEAVRPPPMATLTGLQDTIAQMASDQDLFFNPCGGGLPCTATPPMPTTLTDVGIVDSIVGWVSNVGDMVGGLFSGLFDTLIGGFLNFFGLGGGSTGLSDFMGISQCIGPMDIPAINSLLSTGSLPSMPGCLGGGGNPVTVDGCADSLITEEPLPKECVLTDSGMEKIGLVCPIQCRDKCKT